MQLWKFVSQDSMGQRIYDRVESFPTQSWARAARKIEICTRTSGDVLGIYHPPTDLSSLAIYYAVDTGLFNHAQSGSLQTRQFVHVTIGSR